MPFGGEPLLNFTLLREIVRYVKEKVPGRKTTFGITTNGTLFTDEVINFFVAEEIHPLVSFDGPAEYQRANRKMKNGQDSYDVVLQNMEGVQKSGDEQFRKRH